MKRGLAIALVLVLLAIVVALSLKYALRPNLSAEIIAECSRDAADKSNCIAREEQFRDVCAGKTGQELHDCAADISGDFDEPTLKVTTGPLTE